MTDKTKEKDNIHKEVPELLNGKRWSGEAWHHWWSIKSLISYLNMEVILYWCLHLPRVSLLGYDLKHGKSKDRGTKGDDRYMD